MRGGRDRILLVDDDEQLADILSIMLEAEGYAVSAYLDGVSAMNALVATPFSLVLLDLRLGEESGLDLLPRIKECRPNIPVLMITAHGDVESAVEAFRFGASGYIRKPFEEGDLKSQIAEAIESTKVRSAVRESENDRNSTDVRSIFHSRDSIMEPVLRRIAMAARVNSNVVVTGESGTGKELVARALHLCGPRREGAFVAFNCAALPESLLESELFGHMRGAYTDAKENKPGLFVRANHGTLFLDEIGDAPLSIQSKLLRVLQEREVLPLGGRAPVKVDVRIVAATHRSLSDEVAHGKFRQDLYYRLQVIPIHIPPLRERKKDIIFLASLFASNLAKELKMPFEGFSQAAIGAMEAHCWPGNVRELQNRIEHALVIGMGGWISGQQLFPEFEDAFSSEGDEKDMAKVEEPMVSFKEAKHLFERSYLIRVLSEARGNIARAARLAAKSRAELYGLLRKHGLEPDKFKQKRG